MKLRIFNWNEAIEAAVENKDEYAEFGDCVFGIKKSGNTGAKLLMSLFQTILRA